MIIKRVYEDAAWSDLRNEHRILERLRDVPGCPRVLRLDPSERTLALEDFGGIALSA